MGCEGHLRSYSAEDRRRECRRLVRRRQHAQARRGPQRPDRLRSAAEGDKLKIGITCYPTYGGSGIVATALGLQLAMRGDEVHFITYPTRPRLAPDTPLIHSHEAEVSISPLSLSPPYCLAL